MKIAMHSQSFYRLNFNAILVILTSLVVIVYFTSLSKNEYTKNFKEYFLAQTNETGQINDVIEDYRAKIKRLNNYIIDKDQQISEMSRKLEYWENFKPEPTIEYEKYRRKVLSDIKYFWTYFKQMHSHFNKQFVNSSKDWENFYTTVYEYNLSWLSNLRLMTEHDTFNDWREMESNSLSNLIQARLEYLQNPKDCSHTKFIKCTSMDKVCGWGCHAHYITECLGLAYGYGRTLIYDSHGFLYNKNGFTGIIEPYSKTCTETPPNATQNHKSGMPKEETVYIHAIGQTWFGANYPPRKVPKDIASRLDKLNGNPSSWWIGQMLKYGTQLTQDVQNFINDSIIKVGFKHPIVGVHIRRTDKSTETKLHSIEEYMEHVEEFYDVLQLSQKLDKRRIYLSTDDASVIDEAKIKYPNYEILSNHNFAEEAGVKSRYSIHSLKGIMTDVHILAHCDYFVCTLSSNIGRLVFEYMQTISPDATDKIVSLDHLYVSTDGHMQEGTAVFNHIPNNEKEIGLQIGDNVIISAIWGTNYSVGIQNNRLQKYGNVPAFKVQHYIEALDMPTYPDAVVSG